MNKILFIFVFILANKSFAQNHCTDLLIKKITLSDEEKESLWFELYSADDLVHRTHSERLHIARSRMKKILNPDSGVLNEEAKRLAKKRKQEQFEVFSRAVEEYVSSFYGQMHPVDEIIEEEKQRQRLSHYTSNDPVDNLLLRRLVHPRSRRVTISQSFWSDTKDFSIWELNEQVLKHVEEAHQSSNSSFVGDIAKFSMLSRSFFWRESLEREDGSSFDFNIGAIGEGDIEAYIKIHLTAGIMLNWLHREKDNLNNILVDIDDSSLNFARKMYPLVEDSVQKPSYRALQEGILSLSQYLLFLTSAKVEGASTADLVQKLLSPIDERGLSPIGKFTQVLAMGFLGPAHLNGILMKEPVRLSRKGRVVPSADLMELIEDIQIMNTFDVNKQMLSSEISTLGCPMAMRCDGEASPVDALAAVFLSIYEDL